MTSPNGETKRQTTVITVSLYDEQLKVLNRLARESGMENISAATRVIINDYARRNGMDIETEVSQS